MFLSQLNNKQKELFIEIAIKMATIDGVFNEDEKAIISAYCKEMEISYYYEKNNQDIVEILKELNRVSDDKEKRIITFELIGVCLADYFFHEKEKELLKSIIDIFGIKACFIDTCEEIIKEYMTFQHRINDLVL